MHENPSWIIVSQKAAADISYQALNPAVVLTTFAFLTVVLRWYSRVRLSGVYGVEDVVATLALAFSIAFTGTVGGEFEIDISSTNDEVRASLFVTISKLMFAGALFYHLAVNLVRFSILFQYHRVFQHLLSFRICLYILLLATFGAMAWGALGIVFLCHPVQKYWNVDMPGKCMDAGDHFSSCSLVGIALDCVIWAMPMPVLGRLRLERRAKVGLLLPFGLGLFVCIVSVLRIVHVQDAAEKGDVSKSGSYAAIWSTTEVNVAIICSSLLVMRPLLTCIIPCLGTSKVPSVHEENGGIRRMMSISTLEESLAETEGVLEARCETYVWAGSDAEKGEKGKMGSV